VFLLPDGFTVNSLDGTVVNNEWVGAQETPTPVPEPASLLLVATGVGAANVRRLRRFVSAGPIDRV